MSFPTPWLVRQERFTKIGEDDLGNDIGEWAPPVDLKVIAIQPSSVESITGYTSRVVSDVDLALPPAAAVGFQDRFTLPDKFGPDVFEVVAVEDANYGFHQWNPGIVVKLRRVTG